MLLGLASVVMDETTPTTESLLRAQAVQLAELRELLGRVAVALERLAIDEPDPDRQRLLLRHAMRLRKRLWEM